MGPGPRCVVGGLLPRPGGHGSGGQGIAWPRRHRRSRFRQRVASGCTCRRFERWSCLGVERRGARGRWRRGRRGWRSVSPVISTAERRATSRAARASRSPVSRGVARSSRPMASRATRTASRASVFLPIRRAGRIGLSISRTCSPLARSQVARPRPQLPQPSITQFRQGRFSRYQRVPKSASDVRFYRIALPSRTCG